MQKLKAWLEPFVADIFTDLLKDVPIFPQHTYKILAKPRFVWRLQSRTTYKSIDFKHFSISVKVVLDRFSQPGLATIISVPKIYSDFINYVKSLCLKAQVRFSLCTGMIQKFAKTQWQPIFWIVPQKWKDMSRFENPKIVPVLSRFSQLEPIKI